MANKRVLITLQFIFLIISTYSFSQENEYVLQGKLDTSTNPLDTLQFDRVIAYNVNYDSTYQKTTRRQMEVPFEELKLYKPYGSSKRIMSPNQISMLYYWLSDTTNFGEYTAACWEPRLVFQFLNNGKEVFRIALCEQCGYFMSTAPFPAPNHIYIDHEYENDGEIIRYRQYKNGISMHGYECLTELCESLNMLYYSQKNKNH